MKNRLLTIIAGPCSIDDDNIGDVYDIADIEVAGKRAVAGARIVGLKSRTKYSPSVYMGVDHEAYLKNCELMLSGSFKREDSVPLPSVEIAKRVFRDTGLLIASEIVDPAVQLPQYDGEFGRKFMPWNPAVNQLGWHVRIMSRFAEKNNWHIGIKNGKWIGDDISVAESLDGEVNTPIESVWSGLVSYAGERPLETVLIHRGVDVHGKGDYRNIPIHGVSARVKKKTGCLLYFDPSHICGPRMRDEIVSATIDAMKMKLSDDEYLYDGVLVEVGNSKTDTHQHISVKELKDMLIGVSEFRDLTCP